MATTTTGFSAALWLRRHPYRAAALAGAAVAGDVAFDPLHRHVPLCPFHAVTGAWCPLCGGLRAADSLMHGDLATAAHYNLLFVAALPVVLVWWADWIVRSRSGQPPRTLSRGLGIAVIVLAVVFTVVRNLPFAQTLRGG